MTDSAGISEKRSNPVVDRYVTTDYPIPVILQESTRPRSLLEEALLQLHDCLEGRRLAKDTVEMAQAVPLSGWDPELLILFLSNWAELSCRIGRPSIAQALIHRARSLFTDTTHPEVIATTMLVESILADTTGNKAKCERVLKEILQRISPHSARRRLYVWELALFLALQGRGVEAQAEMKELSWQSNDRFKVSRLLIVQFTDAIETGRVQDASMFMSELQTSLHAPKDLARIPYTAYQDLLALMHVKPESSLTPLPEAERVRLRWVAVIHALLRRDTEDALRMARVEANRLLGLIFTSGFDSFNLIRAELATGNGESALRLIKMRQGRGNHHYLDHFFSARAQWIMANRTRAVEHFSELLQAVERYRAKGRLDFEMRLACELSQGDVLDLTRSAEKKLQRRKPGLPLPGVAPVATAAPPAATGEAAPTPTPGIEAEEVDEAARLGVNIIRGKSATVIEIRESVLRFADLDAPVLITGETGTGKELVARALHLVSKRRQQPFTAVNCGAITETLLESELFGHERGAFTGAERANKGLFEATGEGTILLDEIGDITARLQSSLLRVLETGEIRAVGSTKTRRIHCHIVAATNSDLAKLADEGRFRRDLMFRLQRLGIYIPPLRERRDDVLPLVRHFLDLGRRIGIHATMTDDLREALRVYDWPGNIRELRNVIERMRLMHSDKLAYALDDLDLRFQSVRERIKTEPAPPPAVASVTPPPAPPAVPPVSTGVPPVAVPPRQLILPPRPVAVRQTDGSMSDEQADALLRKGRSPLRRLDRLRVLFTRYGKLTRKEVMDILGVSPNTATKDLQALCKDGTIRCVEPTQSSRSRYFERIAPPPAAPEKGV